ncbi:MAG: hypothetical protein B6U89_04635 [Desulfurococcales archaeon ex4484_58]|nr:MAG: hypothetical protein B6U89_04635 [Desulfurococcales archaeon ex4484_58]
MDIRGISRVRLQAIRDKDRVKYFVYLPKELVDELGWVKGDELVVDTVVLDVNVKTRRECRGIIVYREKDLEKIRSM